MMKRILFVLLLGLLPPAYAAEESVTVLGAEFWFMPRNGEAIASHEGVRAAVKKLIAEPEAYLVLRHPETESGELWGQEMQAWLVSLGLVSDRIELQPSAELLEAVELLVVGPDIEVDETPMSIGVPEPASDESVMESTGVEPEQAEPVVTEVAAQPEMEPAASAAEESHEADVQVEEVQVETE